MTTSNDHDLSFQQWSTIQHNLFLRADNGNSEPCQLYWLQGAEVLWANSPDGDPKSESFTHLDSALDDASAIAIVRKENRSASPSISTIEFPRGKVETVETVETIKRSRGRPKVKDTRSLTNPDVSCLYSTLSLPTPRKGNGCKISRQIMLT